MFTQKNIRVIVWSLVLAASTGVGCVPPAAQTAGPEVGLRPSNAEAPAAPPENEAFPSEAECRALAQKAPASALASPGGDVQKQFDDVFQAYHEPFRCCFDAVYAAQSPRSNGQVTLDVEVDHDGKLIGAEVDAPGTTVAMPAMHTCMLDVAKALTYPRPANDMAIEYKRLFSFKARR